MAWLLCTRLIAIQSYSSLDPCGPSKVTTSHANMQALIQLSAEYQEMVKRALSES